MRVVAGFATVMKRDAMIFASYRLGLISLMFSPFVGITLFYFVSRLVQVEPFGSPDAYFSFVVVGIAVLGVVTALLSGPQQVLQREMTQGTLDIAVVSGLGPVIAICALVAFPVTQAFVTGALVLGIASAGFGLDLVWPAALLAIPVSLLVVYAFLPLAVVLLAATLVFKRAAAVTSIVLVGASLVSGAYFPVELLPSSVQWLSQVQPFTPALELLRHVLDASPTSGSPALDVARLAVFGLLIAPALLALRAAIAHTQRTGTIVQF